MCVINFAVRDEVALALCRKLYKITEVTRGCAGEACQFQSTSNGQIVTATLCPELNRLLICICYSSEYVIHLFICVMIFFFLDYYFGCTRMYTNALVNVTWILIGNSTFIWTSHDQYCPLHCLFFCFVCLFVCLFFFYFKCF